MNASAPIWLTLSGIVIEVIFIFPLKAPLAFYPAYYPQPNWDQSGPAKNWAIASVALGVASFIVLLISFTPLGVAFGAVSLTRRSQKNWLAILGIVLHLLGMVASIAVAALLP